MVSNQVLVARLTAGLLIVSITVCGCSHLRRTQAQASAPAPVTQAAGDARAVPAEQEMTATEAAISAAGAGAAAAPAPPVEAGPVLKPGAPKHYTVKRGDTLWGIASMYLRDPWLWPEVWIINPQVANPHLIYPGDTLALAFGADGRPQVSLEQAGAVRLDQRLRSAPLESAIPTIPYGAIAAFLSRPTVLTADQIRDAPYVVAVINRGKRHGLEPGNVLAVDQAGDVVRDLYRGGKKIGSGVGTSFAPKVKLPDERSGTLLVFKVFDRVSFGLIVGASDTIHVADVVRSP